MTKIELKAFVEENSPEKIDDLYNKLYEKLTQIYKKIEGLIFYQILVVSAYFLITKSNSFSLQLGPLTTNDFSFIPKLTPIIYGYLLLSYSVLNAHKADLLSLLNTLNINKYKLSFETQKIEDDPKFAYLTRMIFPFSLWSEVGKFKKKSTWLNCIGIFILLPVICCMYLLPLYFEFLLIKNLTENYWHQTIVKIIVLISIWLSLSVVYFFIRSLHDLDWST